MKGGTITYRSDNIVLFVILGKDKPHDQNKAKGQGNDPARTQGYQTISVKLCKKK